MATYHSECLVNKCNYYLKKSKLKLHVLGNCTFVEYDQSCLRNKLINIQSDALLQQQIIYIANISAIIGNIKLANCTKFESFVLSAIKLNDIDVNDIQSDKMPCFTCSCRAKGALWHHTTRLRLSAPVATESMWVILRFVNVLPSYLQILFDCQ